MGDFDDIVTLTRRYQQNGERVGLVCGCFDILHLGHIELFRFAKAHCDVLVVAVDSDASVRKSKGQHRPIHTQEVRLLQLEELRSVDHAFGIEGEMDFESDAAVDTWRDVLARLRPDVLITHRGADFYSASKKQRADDFSIEVVFHDAEKRFSTTRIEKLYLESS